MMPLLMKSIAFEYRLAHRWYENVNGCRYLAVEKQARESKSSTIASYSNESVDDQKPLDCPINEESTSTFVYSIAEDGGNECEKPFQALAEFKTHHETTHESISNEENVSLSGAYLIWTEHHSDQPAMATDVEEFFMLKVNKVTMKSSSVDELLYAHVSDPPECCMMV